MATIDLGDLTDQGAVNVISGRDRGTRARKEYHIDEIDAAGEAVMVLVPDAVKAVTPSFVLGMFGPTIERLGDVDVFFSKYTFAAKSHICEQVRRGAQFSVLKGSAFEAA